jgi:hypothetical protein
MVDPSGSDRGDGRVWRRGGTIRCWGGLAFAVLFVGCGHSDGLERAAVKGRVTVAGQPLAKGRILFCPLPPTQGPAVSTRVSEGGYELAAKEGPVVGRQRVEVEAELPWGFAIDDEAAFAKNGGRPLPVNPIPPAFNTQSSLVTEIKPGENSFDVSVPITPRR